MVLPSGFVLPPLPYLAVLAASVALVAYGLWRAGVAVRPVTVVALAPWMAVGSALYVVYQLEQVPEVVAPFASSPTVYASTFALAGAVWLAADRTSAPLRVLAGVGFIALAVPVGMAVRYGTTHGGLTLAWPVAGVALATVVAGAVWVLVRRYRPRDARVTWPAGGLVVLGHSVDGFTTAVGIDVLGFAERTPVSRLVMEFAGALPTEPYLGTGWLFVLVKLALAAGVVLLLAEYVRDEPSEGSLLLGVVAAVGLGPGMHNLLLFVVTTP